MAKSEPSNEPAKASVSPRIVGFMPTPHLHIENAAAVTMDVTPIGNHP